MIRATSRGRAARCSAHYIALLLPILAGACSSMGDYPSLALRDFERTGRLTPTEADATPESAPPPPPSTDLVSRLDSLLAKARSADATFTANRTSAERAVAAAGTVTSDSWSTAQVALSSLQASRSSAMVALADLDRMYVDARDEAPLEETPTTSAIAAARDEVSALVASQDQVIATLAARLKS